VILLHLLANIFPVSSYSKTRLRPSVFEILRTVFMNIVQIIVH